MNKYTTYFFYSSFLLGSMVYGTQTFSAIQLPKIINNYLNDFLFMPIVLFVCLKTIIWIHKTPNYHLPLYSILYACVLVSVAFEYYIPKVLIRYTSDPIDIILYFLSGIIFYGLQRVTVNSTTIRHKK